MWGWLAFGSSLVTLALIYSLLAMGLDVQYGLAGLLDFGLVAFFAVGAFTSAIVTLPPLGSRAYEGNYTIGFGLPFPVGVVAAGVMGGLLALLVGATAVRLRGDYLAIATFALATIVQITLSNETWLTRGQFGISVVPQPLRTLVASSNGYLHAYLVMTAVITGAGWVVARRLARSPFGRALRAVREDEIATRSLGKQTSALKLKAFVIGGIYAGVAGSLWVHSIGGVHVNQFVAIITFQVWLAVLLGGAGNATGVVLGSFVLVALREGTRFLDLVPGASNLGRINPTFLPSLRFVVIGMLLVVVVRVAPDGILPERRGRRADARAGSRESVAAATEAPS